MLSKENMPYQLRSCSFTPSMVLSTTRTMLAKKNKKSTSHRTTTMKLKKSKKQNQQEKQITTLSWMTFRLFVRMGTLKNRISKMMPSLRFWVRATARKASQMLYRS